MQVLAPATVGTTQSMAAARASPHQAHRSRPGFGVGRVPAQAPVQAARATEVPTPPRSRALGPARYVSTMFTKPRAPHSTPQCETPVGRLPVHGAQVPLWRLSAPTRSRRAPMAVQPRRVPSGFRCVRWQSGRGAARRRRKPGPPLVAVAPAFRQLGCRFFASTPGWRWRESNPRPSAHYQGFSERSSRCLCSAPPILRTSRCDGPSCCEMSRAYPQPVRAVSHLADARIRADDEPGLTDLT
jgi:hypothetical protein